MSLTTMETTIWRECQRVINNRKMRKKDLLEWSTGKIEAREDETIVYLERLGVYVAYNSSLDKR